MEQLWLIIALATLGPAALVLVIYLTMRQASRDQQLAEASALAEEIDTTRTQQRSHFRVNELLHGAEKRREAARHAQPDSLKSPKSAPRSKVQNRSPQSDRSKNRSSRYDDDGMDVLQTTILTAAFLDEDQRRSDSAGSAVPQRPASPEPYYAPPSSDDSNRGTTQVTSGGGSGTSYDTGTSSTSSDFGGSSSYD